MSFLDLIKPFTITLLLVSNVLLLFSTSYLLYDKYKPVSQTKYLVAGDLAPGFDGLDSNGMPVSIEFTKSEIPTLLMVFTTTCPACEGTTPLWNALANESRPLRFLGISLDEPEKTIPYSWQHRLVFPVMLLTNKEFVRAYKIHSVPLTVLIGTDGRIIDSWQGALNKEIINEIRDSLGSQQTAEFSH